MASKSVATGHKHFFFKQANIKNDTNKYKIILKAFWDWWENAHRVIWVWGIDF